MVSLKKITVLFLFFICSTWAQKSESFQIIWENTSVFAVGDNNYMVPMINSSNMEFNPDTRSIFYTSFFNEGQFVNTLSTNVFNIKYASISDKELGDLDLAVIPASFEYDVYNVGSRGVKRNLIKCSPLVKTQSGVKKVISFELSYTVKKESQRRSSQLSNSDSVLADGDWYQFSLTKSGAYVLTKEFISKLGIDVNKVNPNNLQVYGNGGRMVPLKNSLSYPNDLQEVAIHFVGNDDAVFSDNEYLLFYGEGVDVWNEESETHVNLYDTKSYYYIKVGNSSSKRMSAIDEPTESANIQYNTYTNYMYHELDLVNPVRLGRKWFGEDFSTDSKRKFVFDIANFDSSESCNIKVEALASSSALTSLTLKANNNALGTVNFSSVSATSSVQAVEGVLSRSYTPSTSRLELELDYDNKGVPSSEAYLDFISVETQSKLQGYGKQFGFYNSLAAQDVGVGEYVLSNAIAVNEVWDVTDIYNVKRKGNNGLGIVKIKQNLGTINKYHVVDNSDLYIPSVEANSKVPNQNIKGTVFSDTNQIDYLIIAPNAFQIQANRLAEFHRNSTGLSVKVLTLNEIYREFSSGKQDIGAIRNVIKYIYNQSDPSKRLKYVCLFGGASFDYKNRIPDNTNIVPIFHAKGYSLVSTFMTDDFYGLMDDNEGEMRIPSGIDIAVGRMLFKNGVEADIVVNKVIHYASGSSFGKWRNDVLLVSDDVDIAWEEVIQKGLDDLGTEIEQKKSFFNVKKIHSDSYVQETSSGGERYPEVRKEIVNQIENGVLVMDYFGHGGEEGLAHERILEKTDIEQFKNIDKLPLFITATCEFSRFDNPYRLTAGEMTYLNPKGGAISLISTTRQIGVTSGLNFNKTLMNKLFAYDSGAYPTMAEALRLAKNEVSSFGVTIVSYIGDPALSLAIPKPEVRLTHLNGVAIEQSVDTLKALSLVNLKGLVVDEAGNAQNQYNGVVDVVVYDKKIKTSTLANDQIIASGNLIVLNYEKLGEVIFKGKASVVNGVFEVGFVVPKDIKIAIGDARVSLYSHTANFSMDNTGVDTQLKIGGFDKNAAVDNEPPKLRLYMNDTSFVNGEIVGSSPVLLVYMEDESGISTAGGLGHDISLVVDGDEANPIILNEYYSTEIDTYKRGELTYALRNLGEGFHTAELTVWDVYNNVMKETISFQVVSRQNLILDRVLNYPNPFVNYTEFWFNHNRPNEPLDVQIQIFTVTGKLVKTLMETVTTPGFTSRQISWDGRDDFGDKIGKGVYVYKLRVKSSLTNEEVSRVEKLVVF